MAPGRQIIVLLALIAAGFFLLACGSSDEPDLEGEPFSVQESEDLTNNLTQLETAFGEGDCDQARNKLEGLQQAVEDMPEERDVELRTQLTDALDELGAQIGEECQEEEPTTSTTSTEEEAPTSTVPPETTAPPEEKESTTTTSEEEESTTSTEEEEPPPTTPPGQDGDAGGGSGGTAPGGEFGSDRRAPKSGGAPSSDEKSAKGPKAGKGPKAERR